MKIIKWTGDLQTIVDFYKSCDYEYRPKTGEIIITAVNEKGEISGVVRLSKKDEVLHLRGMQVKKNLQKTGVGTLLLHKIVQETKDDTCYLVGYPHLARFYGKIGFREISVSETPTNVQERYYHAQKRFPKTKFNVMIKDHPNNRSY